MQALTIQQVAQQTGLSVHTLRYYERNGLLEPVDRASSGHRRYSAEIGVNCWKRMNSRYRHIFRNSSATWK
jgi:predicted site-specific integrase-resolvase